MSDVIERAKRALAASGIEVVSRPRSMVPVRSRLPPAAEVDALLAAARQAIRATPAPRPVQILAPPRSERRAGTALQRYQPPAVIPPPSPIKMGYYFDPVTEETGAPNLFRGERNILLFGLNGAGKSTRFLIELLMTSEGRSIVAFDMKNGELAARTAPAQRRKIILNPRRLHVDMYPDLVGDVFNPLEFLDPAGGTFYADVAALAHALIEVDPHDTQKHWPESAIGLLISLICWEVILAKREGGRVPSLVNVRMMLTEAEQLGPPGPDGKRRLVKGLNVTAARMIEEGGPMVASLAGELVREHGLGEIASIGSAAKTPTRWLVDPLMRASLEGHGVDFRRLRDEPTTVYLMMPAGETEFRPWTRLVVSSALRAQFRPGRVGTLFILDEFFSACGRLPIVEEVWSQVRGFGIQLMPILQSATQLQKMFKETWEIFAGQSGATIMLGPPNDFPTAEWMSKRCGVTTIMQASFGQGDGVSSGGGINESFGRSPGHGMSTNQGGGNNYGENQSDNISYQQVERRVLLPNELMDAKAGTGLIWTPGMGTRTIPFFAPNFWQLSYDWVPRVRDDPYGVR